ncbi:MAG: cold shock domain-containing protein, partial [Gemmataceae bacterium]|nr:cold shock domain-containing protein [Gemmataceae bacterium]
AWAIFDELTKNMTDDSVGYQIKTTDAAINCLHRKVEQQIERHEFLEAWKTGLKGVELAEKAMATWPTDSKFGEGIQSLLNNLLRTATALSNIECATYVARKFVEHTTLLARQRHFAPVLTNLLWLCSKLNVEVEVTKQLRELAGHYSVEVEETRMEGTVCRVRLDSKFGYIKSDTDGREYYFHFNQVSPSIAWKDIQPEYRLSFCLGRNKQGTCAVSLAPIDQ